MIQRESDTVFGGKVIQCSSSYNGILKRNIKLAKQMHYQSSIEKYKHMM